MILIDLLTYCNKIPITNQIHLLTLMLTNFISPSIIEINILIINIKSISIFDPIYGSF